MSVLRLQRVLAGAPITAHRLRWRPRPHAQRGSLTLARIPDPLASPPASARPAKYASRAAVGRRLAAGPFSPPRRDSAQAGRGADALEHGHDGREKAAARAAPVDGRLNSEAVLGEVLTAIVTPFREDGAVDYDAFRALAQHLVEHGSDGLVVTGTTGEAPTLSDARAVVATHLARQLGHEDWRWAPSDEVRRAARADRPHTEQPAGLAR